MALRISGARAPMPEPAPEEMMEEMPMMGMSEDEPMMEEEPMFKEDMMDGGNVDPMVAGYKTPDMGPFMCGNCKHYSGDGACEIVAGPIDEQGVCNLFETGEAEAEEEPMEEPMEEAPVEEEPPTEEEEY